VGDWRLGPSHYRGARQQRDAEVLCLESITSSPAMRGKLLSVICPMGVEWFFWSIASHPPSRAVLRELGFEVEESVTRAKKAPKKISIRVFQSPIFHPFSLAGIWALMDIKVSKYFRLKSTQACAGILRARSGICFSQEQVAGQMFVVLSVRRTHLLGRCNQTFIPLFGPDAPDRRAEIPPADLSSRVKWG